MACLWELEMTQHYRVTKVLGDKLSIQGQCNNHSGPASRVCPRVLLSPRTLAAPYEIPALSLQDPQNMSMTVIVIRSLVPGGVADRDRRVFPGDRLVYVSAIFSNIELLLREIK